MRTGPDITPHDYLNQPEELPSALPRRAWSIRLRYKFAATLYRKLADLAHEPNGQPRLQGICDPATMEKREERHHFVGETVRECAPQVRQALKSVQAGIDKETKPTVASNEAIAKSACEAHDACEHLMAQFGPEDWFVPAVDEATGICPPDLVRNAVSGLGDAVDGPAQQAQAATVGVAKDCVAILTRMFSKPHPDSGSTSRITTTWPQRFWLLVTDTNASISPKVRVAFRKACRQQNEKGTAHLSDHRGRWDRLTASHLTFL